MLEKYSAQDENLIQLPPEEVGAPVEGSVDASEVEVSSVPRIGSWWTGRLQATLSARGTGRRRATVIMAGEERDTLRGPAQVAQGRGRMQAA